MTFRASNSVVQAGQQNMVQVGQKKGLKPLHYVP